MSDLKDPTVSSPEDNEEALKKRLLGRIAIAGIVVVALLGSLAVFDAMNVAEQKPAAGAPPPTAGAEPAPLAAAPEATGPAGKEVSGDKAGAPSEKPAAPEAGAPEAAGGKSPPPEPPKVAAEPSVPEHTASRPLKPLTPPASARQAMIRPGEAVIAPAPETGRSQPLAGGARPPAAASPGPLSPPLNRAMQGARHYVLQMGVFNNVANAEELRAKLELNGIPAQIEARVQVGPFASREEADAAREKLRALGLESGIMTAIRK